MAVVNETVLRVATSESVKNINTLKSSIETLQHTLSTLKEGTEQYTAINDRLATKQQELNTINEVAKSSYSDLISAIKFTADSTHELASATSESAGATKESTDANEENKRSLKDLRTEISGYRDQLLNLDKGSEEYRDTLIKLTTAQNELRNINNLAANSYGGIAQVLTNTTKVAAGLASGFSAYQSITKLVGGNNEALEKTFVKLQAAMALVQGLQGLAGLNRSLPAFLASLKNSVPLIKAFGAALGATGIGLVATAVAGLTAGIIALSKANRDNNEEIAESNRLHDIYIQRINDLQIDTEAYLKVLRARGAQEEEIIEARTEAIGEAIDQSLAELQRLFTNDAFTEDFLNRLLQDIIQNADYYLDEAGQKILDKRLRLYAGLNKAQREYFAETLQQYYDDYGTFFNLLSDATNQFTARNRENNSTIESENKAASQRRIQLQIQEQAQIEQINQKLANNNLTSYQLQIQQLTETYNSRLALLQKYGEDTSELTRQFEANIRYITLQEQQDLTNSIIQSNEQGFTSRLTQTTQFYNELISANDLYIQQLQTDLLEAELRLFSVDTEAETEEVNTHISNLTNLINGATAAIGELQLEYLETYSETLQEILDEDNLSAEFRIQTEQELADTLNSIGQQQLNNRKSQIQQEIAEANRQATTEAEINQRRVLARESLLSSFASIGSSLGTLFGQETAAGKAAAIAGATIDTFRAAIGAYQSLASIPFVGPALGAAAATAAGLAGAAQVKNILSVNTSGSNTVPSVDIATPSYNTTTPDISGWYTPELTPVVNELQSEEERDVQRVFILESDISRSNSRVLIRETETNI